MSQEERKARALEDAEEAYVDTNVLAATLGPAEFDFLRDS